MGPSYVDALDEDVLMDSYLRIDNNIGRRIFENWKYNKDEDRERNKKYREDMDNEEDDRLNGLYNDGIVLWNSKKKEMIEMGRE